MNNFIVVLANAGNREEIIVQATGRIDAVYKAKQKWLETHSSEPTVIGIKK